MTNEELRERYNPEGSLLRRQQTRMLEILLEVDRICQKHDIRYWLSSGTLIGALRHDGFIPWDDDLDIEMMREDYLRLMEVLPQELPEWLALQNDDSDPNGNGDSNSYASSDEVNNIAASGYDMVLLPAVLGMTSSERI